MEHATENNGYLTYPIYDHKDCYPWHLSGHLFTKKDEEIVGLRPNAGYLGSFVQICSAIKTQLGITVDIL